MKMAAEKSKIFMMLVFFSAHLFSDVSGWVDLGGQTTDNAYSDSRQLPDSGYIAGAGLDIKGRLFKKLYYSGGYSMNASGFFTNNLENEVFHSLFLCLRTTALDGLEAEIRGGIDYSLLPNAAIYGYSDLNMKSKIKYFVLDHTALTALFSYEDKRYQDYNLDNKTLLLALGLEQECSIYDVLYLKGSYGRADYSEKYLYLDVLAGEPSYENTLRVDMERIIDAGYSHEFSTAFGADLFYRFEALASNDNFLDWGPAQYETVNTTIGDETIINDYSSLESNSIFVKLRFGIEKTRLEINGSYGIKSYAGRIIKDSADTLSSVQEKRKDYQFLITANYVAPLSEEYLLKLIGGYEINNSNDLLYNYRKTSLGAIIEYIF